MNTRNIVLNLVLMFAFALAACGGTAPDAMDKPEDAMTDNPTEEAILPGDTPTPDLLEKPTEEAMAETPTWFSSALTEVQTGASFTINDLKGKVVLVEMMAVWCPKCYTQQLEIQSFHAALGEREDYVSISLDIDPNEDAGILQQYVQQTGFTWKYAIASQDIAREIASLYGDQFLNPPSTPILIIDRKGVAHPLPFGIKSAEDLLNYIQPFLDENM